MKNIFDKKHLPFGNAFAIKDLETIKSFNNFKFSIIDIIEDQSIQSKFLNKFTNWVLSTKNNKVLGLEDFKFSCFSNATTESFDKFYLKYSNKRFRFFKNEYVYHKLNCRNQNFKWKFLEEDDLCRNDAVIVSLPFSDTGDKHQLIDHIFDQCNNLQIPVLIDCTYFGTCANIEFDFRHSCIKEIVFSLSKSFYSAHIRIGVRYSKDDDDDLLFVLNKMNYTNRISLSIGLMLINNFSPDYIFDKYRQRQIDYCEILGVNPSNTVLFGIGNDYWKEYTRNGETNRLSFHKFLAEDNTDLIKDIFNDKIKNN